MTRTIEIEVCEHGCSSGTTIGLYLVVGERKLEVYDIPLANLPSLISQAQEFLLTEILDKVGSANVNRK